jgi:3-isopropylmalate dehydrogenase
MLQGGMGIAASGNLHPGKTSMFEPIHGSAPKYAGKNVACPLGAIMAVSMMLEYIGEVQAAKQVENAVSGLLISDAIHSVDSSSGIATDKYADMIIDHMRQN